MAKIYESPDSQPSKSVTFWYGDCESAGGEGACAYDFTINVYDICGRHFKLFNLPRSRLTKIRGVPAGEFGNGLELYTGDSVIVINADAVQNRDAAGKLRSLDGQICHPKISPLQ